MVFFFIHLVLTTRWALGSMLAVKPGLIYKVVDSNFHADWK